MKNTKKKKKQESIPPNKQVKASNVKIVFDQEKQASKQAGKQVHREQRRRRRLRGIE